MGAQQSTLPCMGRIDIERVVHGPRRMIGGDIECREVVEVVFDFRALRHGKTDVGKQAFDTQSGARDRMQATGLLATPA